MKQGLSRYRRMATAGAAGAIALSFLSVLGVATPASATSPFSAGNTLAASAPTMISGQVNQPAGDWTITLTPGATGPGVIMLTTTDFNEGATVAYDHVPSVDAPSTVGECRLP